MLDRNQRGAVEAEEFILGCMLLKGGAKSLDVAKLHQHMSMQTKAISFEGTSNRIRDSSLGYEAALESKVSRRKSLRAKKGRAATSTALRATPRIQKVEERAMLLSELQDVVARIKGDAKEWRDHDSKEAHTPSEVNLYVFNRH